MSIVMQWLRDHLLPAERPHPSPALREASHRLNNESQALRSAVTRAAGGPQNLELLIKRMQDDKKWT